jgi:hypothetical protein
MRAASASHPTDANTDSDQHTHPDIDADGDPSANLENTGRDTH